MQIVIDIDEETLQDLYDSRYVSPHIKDVFRSATTLPKGHGRLIDALRLKAKMFDLPQHSNNSYWDGVDDVGDLLDTEPTIIEADKKYEAKVITRGNCMICGKELTEGLFFCKECEEKAASEFRQKRERVEKVRNK